MVERTVLWPHEKHVFMGKRLSFQDGRFWCHTTDDHYVQAFPGGWLELPHEAKTVYPASARVVAYQVGEEWRVETYIWSDASRSTWHESRATEFQAKVSPDGNWLWYPIKTGDRLVAVRSGQTLHTLRSTTCRCFSQSGAHWAGSPPNELVLAKLSQGSSKRLEGGFKKLAFCGDEFLAAGSFDGTIRLLRLGDLDWHSSGVASRGRLQQGAPGVLLTCTEVGPGHNDYELFQVPQGKRLQQYRGCQSALLSPDGSWLALEQVQQLQIVEAKTGQLVWQTDSALSQLCFSQDGRQLAGLDQAGRLVLFQHSASHWSQMDVKETPRPRCPTLSSPSTVAMTAMHGVFGAASFAFRGACSALNSLAAAADALNPPPEVVALRRAKSRAAYETAKAECEPERAVTRWIIPHICATAVATPKELAPLQRELLNRESAVRALEARFKTGKSWGDHEKRVIGELFTSELVWWFCNHPELREKLCRAYGVKIKMETCKRCGDTIPSAGIKHNSICWGCWNN